MLGNLRKALALIALGVMATGTITSCASAPPARPAVDIEPEKQSYKNGSLWPGANKKNILFSDNKASRIGDIVTVHVIEKTTALNKSDTTDQTDLNNSITLDTGAVTPTSIKLGGGKKFRGTGGTSRSDQFSATVSCVVTEVLGNGNMVVEGQRRMTINNEEQYIMVRGMVRPDDIKYNNTILSSQMANADISYTGAGGMDGGKGPGFIGKMLNKVWPF